MNQIFHTAAAFVLPVSVLGTLIAMLVTKFSIDNLSLMGIVLAVTFLVDDAIVVLENTVRHLDDGMKPIPAAVRSMKEITFTVISTTSRRACKSSTNST